MTFDQDVSLFSATIAFMGLLFVAWQLRQGTKQREKNSLIEIYNINRQLLSLGFSHPPLFEILADAENVNPTLERRYLQLWLNQFSLIYAFMDDSVFKRELKDSLLRDFTEFMGMENMKRHWRHHGSFYPVSFREFVNDLVKKSGPPLPTAQLDSGV